MRLREWPNQDAIAASLSRGLLTSRASGVLLAMAGSTADGTSAKAMVADRLSNSILSASNLVHLIRDASPTENLAKLPKELLAKTPSIKNTGRLLEQMPSVIVALDAHLDSALQSASQLHMVRSLLLNKDTSAPNSSEHADAAPSVLLRADEETTPVQ